MPSRNPKDLHDAIEKQAITALASMNEILKRLNPLYEVKFICTFRSPEEQAAAYAQGRTTKGQIVTNLKSGGAHNTDLPETPDGDAEAFDIGIFLDGKYIAGNNEKELDLYKRCAPAGILNGFDWGGNWKGFKDYPHYERPNWKNLK